MLLLFIISCSPYRNARKTIDITRYNAIQVNGIAHVAMLHGYFAEQSRSPNGDYRETYFAPNPTNYGGYREYYNTGELKRKGASFSDIFYGKHETYDKSGKLIEEIDYDAPYQFSLFSLQCKMKRELRIDIINKNVLVSRSAESNPPTYTIILDAADAKRTIMINGNTGGVISNIILPVK